MKNKLCTKYFVKQSCYVQVTVKTIFPILSMFYYFFFYFLLLNSRNSKIVTPIDMKFGTRTGFIPSGQQIVNQCATGVQIIIIYQIFKPTNLKLSPHNAWPPLSLLQYRCVLTSDVHCLTHID